MTGYRRIGACDEPVVLDGERLSVEEVVEVARHRRRVVLAPEARHRIACCRAMVEVLLDTREKVYGLTTGFGRLRDVAIDIDDVARLQTNLIRSHASGVGDPFPEDVVRAALLLRANTLCRGNSGVRLDTVLQLLAMLNDDVYPFVPRQGSVGASGDLAPLSHLVLVLMGDPGGRYYPRSRRADPTAVVRDPAADEFVALPETGFEAVAAVEGWTFHPVRLEAKEGLALNNGTQVMTGLACLTLYDGFELLRLSELSAAMSHEAHRGVLGAYDPRLHEARPQSHQPDVAARVRGYFEGSEILALFLNTAHLQRAHLALEDASAHLDELEAELRREGVTASDPVREIRGAVAGLVREVEAVVPVQPDGTPDPSAVAAWGRVTQRGQIREFRERLAPLRRLARTLIEKIQHPWFPVRPPTHKAESALVAALDQITRAVPDSPLVQDDYSFRCFPQVQATAERALWHVHEVVQREVNSATDNPLLFPPEPPGGFAAHTPEAYRAWLASSDDTLEACREGVVGGGNFHGEPVAVAMDYLAIALAEVGSIAERRVAHLVDDHHSRGLPPFLIRGSGLNSGFMIPQYTAAALVSENKVLAHPASVDSIPTCANTEDHVSMGTIAARKAADVVANVAHVVAIELLAAWQGLSFRKPLRPGHVLRQAVTAIREAGIEPYTDDRVMAPDLARMRQIMRGDALLDLVVPRVDATKM